MISIFTNYKDDKTSKIVSFEDSNFQLPGISPLTGIVRKIKEIDWILLDFNHDDIITHFWEKFKENCKIS